MPENTHIPPDDIDLDGWDLFRAAEENRVDITYACLLRGLRGYDVKRGYDVNAKNENGDTPFEHAARNKSYDVTRFLHTFKMGMDLRDTDDQQYA